MECQPARIYSTHLWPNIHNDTSPYTWPSQLGSAFKPTVSRTSKSSDKQLSTEPSKNGDRKRTNQHNGGFSLPKSNLESTQLAKSAKNQTLQTDCLLGSKLHKFRHWVYNPHSLFRCSPRNPNTFPRLLCASTVGITYLSKFCGSPS